LRRENFIWERKQTFLNKKLGKLREGKLSQLTSINLPKN
jgi:hypothetical protein